MAGGWTAMTGTSTAALSPVAAALRSHGPVPVCLATGSARTERDITTSPSAARTLYRFTRSYPGPCAMYGTPIAIGGGQVRTYAQVQGRRPLSLGFTFTRSALSKLPTTHNDGTLCYDRNRDGTIERMSECVMGHNFALDLPKRFAAAVGGPFRWAMVNWNPHGHDPMRFYGAPHFDFHLYTQPRAETEAIRTGPCGGINLVNCDDYAKARKPVPDRYRPADYVDPDAVVPGMGAHLGDPTSPEFHGKPFTRTFIYGQYNGDVTFHEPMIAKAWLDSLVTERVDRCLPVKQAAAWKVAGYYPTRYCVSYRQNRRDYTVSLEGFILRRAGPATAGSR